MRLPAFTLPATRRWRFEQGAGKFVTMHAQSAMNLCSNLDGQAPTAMVCVIGGGARTQSEVHMSHDPVWDWRMRVPVRSKEAKILIEVCAQFECSFIPDLT